MQKIVVIDGQGGKLGAAIIAALRRRLDSTQQAEIIALGTNSAATAAMLKAGADCGATGENPVICQAGDADVIVGPVGIVVANAMLGEITPAMAAAVGAARGHRILIPANRCGTQVVGVQPRPIAELVELAADEVCRLAAE